MTDARRTKWLLAVVLMTSGVLLGLLRWAGRAAAEPEAPEDMVTVEVGKPATAGATPGPDLSFYRALGSGAGRKSGAAPPAADSRGLRPDPGERAAPTGAYIVQVMATRDEAQAKRLVDRLARRGYQAAVLAEDGAGDALYRVRVGRYKERASADAMADKLREHERLEPWVLQEAAP